MCQFWARLEDFGPYVAAAAAAAAAAFLFRGGREEGVCASFARGRGPRFGSPKSCVFVRGASF